ncbi:MAG: hypothetical protein Q9163_005999 [Psora crenata]
MTQSVREVNGSNPTSNPATVSEPISVLFVCLGNICRSPMAEAVFRSLTQAQKNIAVIDSAGTGAYHAGDPPDPRTMNILEDHGIVNYEHVARKVRPSDFTTFHYILAMDEGNLSDLQSTKDRLIRKDPRAMATLMLFGHFGGNPGEEVVDPYYGVKNGFEVAYEQMARFSKGFITQVLNSDKEEAT